MKNKNNKKKAMTLMAKNTIEIIGNNTRPLQKANLINFTF